MTTTATPRTSPRNKMELYFSFECHNYVNLLSMLIRLETCSG